jgi:putative peptidoglycan lipid II flippase
MARNLIHVIFLGSCLVATLFYIAAPSIASLLAPGLAPDGRTLCGMLMRILSPLVVLMPLNALLTCIYYSYGRFAVSALATLFPLLGGISALILLSNRLGIGALPLGIVVFTFVQLLYLLVGLKSNVGELFPISLHVHAGVRLLGRLAPPRFFGFSLMRLDLMADRFFASLLGVGFVTAITYGGKIPALVAGTITSPMTKSFIPLISRVAAQQENKTLSGILSEGLRTLVIILMPLGVFLIMFRGEIIQVVFERGAFNPDATQLTAYPLLFYALGLLFYGFNPLLRGTFFALKDTMTPLKVGILASCLNLFLNWLLIRFLSHGGIALATALVALFSTLSLFFYLERRVGSLRGKDILRGSAKPLAAAIIMGILLKFLRDGLGRTSVDNGYLILGFFLLVGLIAYFGICFMMRVRVLPWKQEPISQKAL